MIFCAKDKKWQGESSRGVIPIGNSGERVSRIRKGQKDQNRMAQERVAESKKQITDTACSNQE